VSVVTQDSVVHSDSNRKPREGLFILPPGTGQVLYNSINYDL